MTKIKIASIAFKARPVKRFGDFADHVSALCRRAASNRPDFVVFPELITAELMSMVGGGEPPEVFAKVDFYRADYEKLFTELAKRYGCCIAAGSHIVKKMDHYYNTAHLFTPDGAVHRQRKLHLIPMVEASLCTPGETVAVFQTEKVKVAMLICYDIEFPVTARLARLKGADLILTPSATAGARGFWRVRHCAQARCVENQVYTVHASMLGEAIPEVVFNGAASVLGPSDEGFPAGGVFAETPMDREAVATAEVDLDAVRRLRDEGTVRPFKDRRKDLLEELWNLERKA